MVMALLLVFAGLVAAWWVVAIAADELIGRHFKVPDRWTVWVVPGWLPTYVRQDYARARQAVTRTRTRPSTPED